MVHSSPTGAFEGVDWEVIGHCPLHQNFLPFAKFGFGHFLRTLLFEKLWNCLSILHLKAHHPVGKVIALELGSLFDEVAITFFSPHLAEPCLVHVLTERGLLALSPLWPAMPLAPAPEKAPLWAENLAAIAYNLAAIALVLPAKGLLALSLGLLALSNLWLALPLSPASEKAPVRAEDLAALALELTELSDPFV